MHLHILGISGTFMSALAILAREAGFDVSGCDMQCYPPVSDLLKSKGIQWIEGYEETSLALKADVVIVGNAMKRGMPVLEAVLAAGKNYTSGPQWLAENILSRYQVIAVAGTHGKTTTTSMLAWILSEAGLDPGFLIGGVASDFGTSARLGQGKWFVIEADEYDSAFFDKRPKFMHYRPHLAILNNLEFDHADIYPDLEAIQLQFHYLLRTIPSTGLVLRPKKDEALNEVLQKGVYSQVETMSIQGDDEWSATLLNESASSFQVRYQGEFLTEVHWSLIGRFNVENALAALAASYHAGVSPDKASKALASFTPVKRRLEVKFNQKGIIVYDDFAHHPTAIARTIEALKQSQRHERIFVVLEFASFTMRSGVHAQALTKAISQVDGAYILEPQDFDLASVASLWEFPYQIYPTTHAIVKAICEKAQSGDGVVVMSNRSFNGIHEELMQTLAKRSLVRMN